MLIFCDAANSFTLQNVSNRIQAAYVAGTNGNSAILSKLSASDAVLCCRIVWLGALEMPEIALPNSNTTRDGTLGTSPRQARQIG